MRRWLADKIRTVSGWLESLADRIDPSPQALQSELELYHETLQQGFVEVLQEETDRFREMKR